MPYGSAPYATAPYSADADPPLWNATAGSAMACSSGLLASTIRIGLASDTLDAQVLMELTEVLALVSGISVSDLITSQSMLIGAVTDAIRLDDRLQWILEAAASDQLAFASVVAGDPVITIALVDALQLAGVAEATISALATVSDILALQELVRSLQDAETTDAVDLVETLEGLRTALASIVSGAVFSDVALGLAVVTVLVPEQLVLADEAPALAIRLALVEDGVSFAVSFTLDGVPYVGLAINTATRGVTEYTNYDFNSQALFDGQLYGAGPAGLYSFGGSSDAGTPIAAYLRTGLDRLAGGKQTRMDAAYLGYRSNGTLQLKVIITGAQGQKVAHVYDLAARTAEATRAGRIKVGKGMKSAYWSFELSNVAGADFDVDVLEIYPLVLDRRLP